MMSRHLIRLALLGTLTMPLFASFVIESPEINPASAASALTFVCGAVLLVRGRKRR